MKYEVIGREKITFKDKVASTAQGRDVYSYFIKLHCVNAPARADAERVEGSQVESFSFGLDNGLLKDVEALPIPCRIDAEVRRNGRYVNVADFDLIE